MGTPLLILFPSTDRVTPELSQGLHESQPSHIDRIPTVTSGVQTPQAGQQWPRPKAGTAPPVLHGEGGPGPGAWRECSLLSTQVPAPFLGCPPHHHLTHPYNTPTPANPRPLDRWREPRPGAHGCLIYINPSLSPLSLRPHASTRTHRSPMPPCFPHHCHQKQGRALQDPRPDSGDAWFSSRGWQSPGVEASRKAG